MVVNRGATRPVEFRNGGIAVRLVAVDVDYRDDRAVAAGVWFADWTAAAPDFTAAAVLPPAAEYEPGEFWRRELPCLLAVLATGPAVDVVIVDGYATLGEGRPGLGARLSAALGVAVVGVAKTRFATAMDAVAVLRGNSRAPLYVSAAGFDLAEAAEGVRAMGGEFRVPALLKAVDRLAREARPSEQA